VTLTDESIDIDIIKQVGIGRQYLIHTKPFKIVRDGVSLQDLMSRTNDDIWAKVGKKNELIWWLKTK